MENLDSFRNHPIVLCLGPIACSKCHHDVTIPKREYYSCDLCNLNECATCADKSYYIGMKIESVFLKWVCDECFKSWKDAFVNTDTVLCKKCLFFFS